MSDAVKDVNPATESNIDLVAMSVSPFNYRSEMNITNQKKYALVDLTQDDVDLIKKKNLL